MLNGEADRRESCSLLELNHPNTQQLQFEHEQTQTNKQTNKHVFINKTLNHIDQYDSHICYIYHVNKSEFLKLTKKTNLR